MLEVKDFLARTFVNPSELTIRVQRLLEPLLKAPATAVSKTNEGMQWWQKTATQMRQTLLEQVVLRGVPQQWQQTPLKVEWLDTSLGNGYRIRKLRYQAIPGLWIPALLYEPTIVKPSTPAVLYLIGHDSKGKSSVYAQTFCINMAKRGVYALNPEWFGFGQLAHPELEHGCMNQLDLCGVRGVSVFYLSLKRALDVFLSLPHVDPKRIGVTGLLGGDRTHLERRQQFYRREHMEEEAKKAAELGYKALYLDSGWDTSLASSIWADDRLGKQKDFVKMLKERYGLSLALHTPLAGWCDVNAYPIEARRKSKDGQVLPSLCSAAPAYLQTKAKRLLKLCEDGAVFLMFDGSAFTGECYYATHGHSLPLTRHEHCLVYLKLTQIVKCKFPKVLIELHAPIVAGVTVRYAPTYFLHSLPHSFDELWGYEFMWDPMDDLLSGRALSLYYVRLAYDIPIYLHIDLCKDNEHALIFWWYASTCQHLGVGGKHPAPKVWEAHKKAMRTYRRIKRFYTQGKLYELDETVHAHVLRDRKLKTRNSIAVLSIFKLATTEVEREIRFKPSDIGLPDNLRLHCIGVPYHQKGSEVTLWVRLPALGHQLVEVLVSR
ncbi:hypothetical protein HRbin17_01665 [bacterium HR17]|uniref:Uncharacterized protein n=1 Tax=Candidatus Fervidibacter japonicus TaxID=2035412 RepID=A0A2H5XD98_9BACT|nr:hypothetical protein HRbin17_01665 [bacterium HR17]